MKRVLILGAHSFIGTALAARLRDCPDRFSVETASLRGADLSALDFRGADAVVHLAAIVHQKETLEAAPQYEAINRDLAVAAAKKAKAEGVRQFIFFSTESVYGMTTGTITKDTLPAPRTLYGRTKLEAERAIAALCDDAFTVTVLRPPMVIGHGAKGNYRRLERLARRLPFCPDYPNRRSLVRIETLCDAVAALIEHPREGVFFPQEPEPVATSDLIAECMASEGRRVRRTTLFNSAVRLLVKTTSAGKKAFGDLVLEDLTELPLSAVAVKEALV